MTGAAAGSGGRRRGGSRLTAVLVTAVLGGGALAGAVVSWAQQQDLRDLPSLQRADAVVVGEDRRRYAADLVEVRFEAEGRQVSASVPASAAVEVGDRAEVAHVPSDPARVRLVEGWAPPWRSWLLLAGAVPIAAVMAVLRRRTRSGAYSAGAALRRRLRGR